METPPYDSPGMPWDSEPTHIYKDISQLDQDLGLISTLELSHPLDYLFPSPTMAGPAHKPDEVVDKTVSVSSVFFPGAQNAVSDTIFRSSDAVLFYVNSQILLRVTDKAFRPILLGHLGNKVFRDNIIDIPDDSAILNIVLHVFYDLSPAKHSPPFNVLENAIGRMPVYGLVPSECITPGGTLSALLLSHAPVHGISLYALAGLHGLNDLGEKASAHLLSYTLSDLTDDLARKMGARYLRRLMSLHLTRVEELKRIILRPPHPHPPTPECDFVDQKKLSRAWALAASYLAWDSRPDLSAHTIQSTLSTLGEHLGCEQCKNVLRGRIKEVIIHWVNVKRTI
ncbi:hypothetical protein CPB83DRAFT_855327 [Crepidotus variabilis]|uniref:BTB domain-containing protein n=1 Tax=Crepidotus variabilis TaxID=179855 RepID=A0A9P6EF24_9AGAR|nr:hypothetical protein CPB83DRAFT_855327 [Crepidotus variabilis]